MLLTLLTRVLTLVSNVIYMTFYGVNLNTDIYTFSLQLPNIIFNSLGTVLTVIIIPIFAGYLGANNRERAYKFANDILTITVIFTVVLSAVALIAAPLILGFTRFKSEGYGFALYALRIMIPVMIFFALNYIFQGILQSFGRFNAPALVSLPSSLAVILYVIFLGKHGVKGLVVATFVGLASQVLILVPSLLKTDYRFRPSLGIRNPDVISAFKLIPPILIATSAYQINMFFNITLAANFKDSVAVVTMAQTLILTAVLTFVYSITAVLFPRFAQMAGGNKLAELSGSLIQTIDFVFYILVPGSLLIIGTRYQLVDFLYGWGKFTKSNVGFASLIFALYGIGIAGVGIKEITDKVFYSLKDTRLPAVTGTVVVVMNIVLSLMLIRFMGVFGIPLAYSLAAITGAFTGVFLLAKKYLKIFRSKGDFALMGKVIFAGGIMYGFLTLTVRYMPHLTLHSVFLAKVLNLLVPVLIAVIIYLLATLIMKVSFTQVLYKRLKPSRG